VAKYGSANVGFLMVGGRNILSRVTQITDGKEAITEETTALGDAAQTHDGVGMCKGELTQDGFYDDATASINDALIGLQGTAQVLCPRAIRWARRSGASLAPSPPRCRASSRAPACTR
jgi:hypothetical protein